MILYSLRYLRTAHRIASPQKMIDPQNQTEETPNIIYDSPTIGTVIVMLKPANLTIGLIIENLNIFYH